MTYKKRVDGRGLEELRKIDCKVGVIPRADGSAMFSFGDTVALAAVYGPKTLHPRHMENPETGILRCHYDMLSFSVSDRKKPGPSRRSSEISMITKEALLPVLKLKEFPNKVVDVHITILQANASTRCAGINAASMALAHAGIPMMDLVSSVSVGHIGGTNVVDLIKEEEDYEEDDEKMATDIPVAMLVHSKKISLLQTDGKVTPENIKDAIEKAMKACAEIGELQKKALKNFDKK